MPWQEGTDGLRKRDDDGRQRPARGSYRQQESLSLMRTPSKSRNPIRGAMLAAVVLAALPDRAPAASVTAVDSGRPDLSVFVLDGPIQGGETLALEAQVGKLPPSKPVAIILNSTGGSLDEGMKLGRFFHRAGISTFVLGYGGGCYSACATAFLGGRDREGRPSRIKMTGGNLGFHQFNRSRTPEEAAKKYTKADMERELFVTRAVALNIIQYLSDIGEDMSFLHLMLKAPAAEITLLSNEDAVTYGIHVMDERNDQVIDSGNIRARIEGRP
jgi:hypothetical protein